MDALRRLFVIVWVIGGTHGLRWTDNVRMEDGTMQVCSGKNIELLWNFTLDRGERLKGIAWGCQPEGQREEVLATFMDDHFIPMSSLSGRLAHLQDGGIELSCATILESGNYSISVRTEDRHNSLTLHRKTASVKVIDTPKTQSGNIHVMRETRAVRDVISGDWHVQLSCGNFSDLGHPPVDVTWTTPKGQQLLSSSYHNGFFYLMLDNPVVGGNYSCGLDPLHPAVACLPADSPLLHTAVLNMGELSASFAVLEARQQEMVQQQTLERRQWQDQVETLKNTTSAEISQWQNQVETLKNKTSAEISQWQNQVETLKTRISDLEKRQDKVQPNSVPVSFHATGTRKGVQISWDLILIFTDVINNQGGGYDPRTGYFTAPVNGTYFFIGTIRVDLSFGNVTGIVWMKKEDSIVSTIILSDDGSRYATDGFMASCHSVLNLNVGEKVWLNGVSFGLLNGLATSFSGFRIL